MLRILGPVPAPGLLTYFCFWEALRVLPIFTEVFLTNAFEKQNRKPKLDVYLKKSMRKGVGQDIQT